MALVAKQFSANFKYLTAEGMYRNAISILSSLPQELPYHPTLLHDVSLEYGRMLAEMDERRKSEGQGIERDAEKAI